jgi:hypothetical protein
MGKYFQEMISSEMGDGNDQVCIKAGIENSLETFGSILFCGPFGVDQKGKVIECVNQTSLSQAPRTIKVIGVDDVGVPQYRLKIFSGVVPEKPGGLEGSMAISIPEVLLTNSTGPGGPIRIPKRISKGGIKDVMVLQVTFGQMPDQAISKVTATSFLGSGLADIKTDFHFSPPRSESHQENIIISFKIN